MTARILLIDDEHRWVEFATRDLSAFEVSVVSDLPTALDKLRSEEFDLIITSSRRLDVLELIRAEYRDKPIIVTTIKPSTQEAVKAYQLGAYDYVPKSFEQHDLLNHVKDVIVS